MRFVRSLFIGWDAFCFSKRYESFYNDLKYERELIMSGTFTQATARMRRAPDLYEIDDYVEKVTGDYTAKGYIVAVFRTKWLRMLRYVVEHRAEGGGSFCHIYSHSNLRFISRDLVK